MIKLVVIDLDGTLLNPQHIVSDATLQAVQKLHEQGVELMIATGRHHSDVCQIAQQLEIPLTLITSNGARVHNSCGALLYENHIPEHLISKVLEISDRYDVHRNIYQGDDWLVEAENLPLLEIHHASGFSYLMSDFDKIDNSDIDKFYFNAEHHLLEPLESELKDTLGNELSITFTTEIYLEVMNLGVSKGVALQALCQDKGLRADEVMAFGDGFNDLDMLQWVGHPVVMENASEALKQQLPKANITASNADNGVANYLHKTLLATS